MVGLYDPLMWVLNQKNLNSELRCLCDSCMLSIILCFWVVSSPLLPLPLPPFSIYFFSFLPSFAMTLGAAVWHQSHQAVLLHLSKHQKYPSTFVWPEGSFDKWPLSPEQSPVAVPGWGGKESCAVWPVQQWGAVRAKKKGIKPLMTILQKLYKIWIMGGEGERGCGKWQAKNLE